MMNAKKILLTLLMSLSAIALAGARDMYWESPAPVTNTDTRFPSAVSFPVANGGGQNNTVTVVQPKASAVFWEEIDSAKKRLYLSARTTTDGVKWRDVRRFAGPITYSGEVPDVYSAAVNSNGIIVVAALTGTREITAYISSDGGRGFHKSVLPGFNNPLVAPRIYAASTGGFVLFASLGQNESFSLQYATSSNGESWSSFRAFEPATESLNPFVPFLSPIPGGDMVVYQAQYASATRLSYQLFATVSKNGMNSWSSPVLITGQESLSTGATSTFSNYNNQRPYVLATENTISLAWERTWYSSENATIWYASLTPEGRITGIPEQISSSGNANRPILFTFDGLLHLIWFDTRSGVEKVYLSQKQGALWEESLLSRSVDPSSFAYPVVSNRGNELSFVWQQKPTRGDDTSRIIMLLSDHTVLPPTITPRSFREDRRYASDNATATVKTTDDSSGVAGYSWIWTQNIREEPPLELMRTPSEKEIDGTATADGPWYFKARQLDFAGNWSDSVTVTYFRDTTPPLAPSIFALSTDDNGLVMSNTFTMDWQQNNLDDDVVGYTWSLQYVSPLPSGIVETKRHPLKLSPEEVRQKLDDLLAKQQGAVSSLAAPPRYNQGSATSASYTNRRNGLYAFSVAAIDSVGNIGPAAISTLLLDKYVPSTYITTVNAVPDEFGTISLTVLGGGYTYDGTITSVFIDRDGKAPYDREFSSGTGSFRVTSDNRITGISLKDLEEGKYRIGLVHSDRGLYFSGRILTVTETGTVKIQNTYDFEPDWAPVVTSYTYHINIGTVLLWTAFALALIGLFAAIRGLSGTAREAVAVRREVTALITGDIMPQEKKRKSAVVRQKGMSLRIKLAGFTIALVVAIVALVSIPLGYIMIKTQEQTLSSGLHDRVNVLLDSLATGAKAYLPTSDILQMSYLPDQTQALPEAKYATITGLSANANSTDLGSVWATNDPDILQKIDTKTLSFGTSHVTGLVTNLITGKCTDLDKEASKQAGEIAQNIAELNQEGISLALRTDDSSVKRRDEIATITTQLNTRLTTTLSTLSASGTGSYPAYDSTKIERSNTSYLFYKPVLFRQGSEQTYVRGIVFVEISTEALVKRMDQARNTIFYTAAAIAVIAIIIGFIGSFVLATIIIKPIRKLAAHVAMIRDTADKETLADKDIKIKSRDEIGVLGDTVNEMTHGLAQAAAVTKNLIVGKDIQTKFIPLQTDEHGNTLTTGSLKAKGADFFSYYAGADELSGDYFDYKQIDEHHYAIIKCDVSGHGVPAALIMVEVATLFLNYFNDWNMKSSSQGINLAPVVGKINDLLESRGFKGRFAAFTLCLLNTQTGEVWFCNAGDNLVQIYDGTERKKKTVTLQETPAAGMFSTDLIDMKGGYKVAKLTLKKDDVLFLYTDGIEEAKRNFRDASYKVIPCAEQGLKDGQPHGNHNVGETSEEMTPERVTAIIESVYARKPYVLSKYHNPVAGEELVFDFTNCSGTAEDAIMALVSVEKIFRLYKPTDVKPTDRVRVDRKIDSFLKAHFMQYRSYCGSIEEVEAGSPYLYYTGVCEDPQYDDLTLVGIKKE